MTVRRRACPKFLTGLLTLALAAGAGRSCPAAEEKSLPADLALVPRDGVFFASVRVADLLRSEPGKQLLARLRKEPDTTALAAELEKELGVPLADVERLTLMPPRTLIVRTARPYDREKVLGRLAPRGRRQKYGGRTFYQDEGGGTVVYLADERVYLKTRAVFARVLTQFLDRAARGGPGPLADALEQAAGRHHVVAAMTPLALLPVRLDDRTAPRRGGAPRLGEDPAVRFGLQDLIDNLPVEFLPFKPLLRARVGVLVADLGEESKLEARVVFPDKDAAQDGETAIKTGLYVLRELLPRVYSGARLVGVGPEKSPPPLLRQVRASLKNAVVATRGPVVTVSARFRVDAAAVGTLAAQVALAAGRTRAINDLKQIGLAMHNFAAAFQYLPPPAVCGKDGKPLLSWRVALLPYLDEGKLYKEFKLDEPWDSPHNKKLLEKMPRVYAPVRGKTRQPYSTYYQVFVGREGPLPGPAGARQPVRSVGPALPRHFHGRHLQHAAGGRGGRGGALDQAGGPAVRREEAAARAGGPVPRRLPGLHGGRLGPLPAPGPGRANAPPADHAGRREPHRLGQGGARGRRAVRRPPPQAQDRDASAPAGRAEARAETVRHAKTSLIGAPSGSSRRGRLSRSRSSRSGEIPSPW